jgi:threonine synthase
MNELQNNGVYSVDSATAEKISNIFWASFANEGEILKTIKDTYAECAYVIDPHTAVGVNVYQQYTEATKDTTKTVIVSTASPFKFNTNVVKAIFGHEAIENRSEYELLEMLGKECNLLIPAGLKDIDKREILHNTVCEKEQIASQIVQILGL